MSVIEQSIALGALVARHVPAARELVREAFAEVLGEAEPGEFWNDRDYVTCRWNAPHTRWFAATFEGELVGVACVAQWGSQAVVGPLAVAPDHWEHDIAQQLMARVCAQVAQWGCTHAGLFTFPDSPRHLALYQKFDFWPGHLAVVMSREVFKPVVEYGSDQLTPTSVRAHCREVLGDVVPGLEVDGEIDAVLSQGTGSVIATADGFAICHYGQHCEAGAQTCYVRVAAVRPGSGAAAMAEVLAHCEALAWREGASHLLLGVNTGRRQAYRWLLGAGYRTRILGVAMHRGEGYDQQGVWLLDDWR